MTIHGWFERTPSTSANVFGKKREKPEEKDNMLSWSEEDIPACPKQREIYVMQQIELDNLRDIEDPFVQGLHHDERVNKIAVAPLTIAPNKEEKSKKLKEKVKAKEAEKERIRIEKEQKEEGGNKLIQADIEKEKMRRFWSPMRKPKRSSRWRKP